MEQVLDGDKMKKKIISMCLCLMLSIGVLYGCTLKDRIEGNKEKENVSSEKEQEKFQVYPLGDGSQRILITNLFEEQNLGEQDATYFYNEQYETHFLIKEGRKAEGIGSLSLEEYLSLSRESVTRKLHQVEDDWLESSMERPDQREYYVRGRLDEESITYAVKIIETEDQFYEMILWSFTENMEENKAYYEDLLRSFKKMDVASESFKGERNEPEL